MLFEHIAISCDLLAAQHGCCYSEVQKNRKYFSYVQIYGKLDVIVRKKETVINSYSWGVRCVTQRTLVNSTV